MIQITLWNHKERHKLLNIKTERHSVPYVITPANNKILTMQNLIVRDMSVDIFVHKAESTESCYQPNLAQPVNNTP